MPVRKLGLVGGMGPESTIPYYHDIVYGVQKRLGRSEFPPLVIESVNVFDILKFCTAEDYGALTDYLLSSIEHLAAAGADFAAMAANTPHIVFDELQRRSPIPLLSIVEATCAEAQRRGIRRLALLGTIFTMEGEFFKAPFRRAGIEILVPDGEERRYISDRIYGELELGIVKPETLEGFQRVIRRLGDQEGAEALVLGCTELPMLLNDQVSPLPCLDTVEIHVRAIVDEILRA
jgi:aspartate racemase